MTTANRPTLGQFMDLTCFHYLRHGAEATAGRALIVAAGRQRGQDIVEGLNLLGKVQDAAEMHARLGAILGADGTHLCLVQAVTAKPDGGYEVRIAEGACTAGVHDASEPYCAFTLGVFIGAISAFAGVRMLGKETNCMAMNHAECVYQIDPLM